MYTEQYVLDNIYLDILYVVLYIIVLYLPHCFLLMRTVVSLQDMQPLGGHQQHVWSCDKCYFDDNWPP